MKETPQYMNQSLSPKERAQDLVSRMTLDEKVSQMLHEAKGIKALGVPAYNWWNECLHGVARAGTATVFPQAIGLGATFNPELIYRIATAISDEARAKYHMSVNQGDRGQYKGLTFWSPNINIFRDPRWGRGHETYGEDPHLTSEIGLAFIKGLQGDDPDHLKTAACVKHFAVHSGPEEGRHSFDAKASLRDIHGTYLPAFYRCVTEGKVESVMGAYNRLNNEPCCSNDWLNNRLLRDQWGFEGHYVSDCGAVCDISENHRTVATKPEAAARAVKGGCDLNCGGMYGHLLAAVEEGLISEDDIDRAVIRLMATRYRLGIMDGTGTRAYEEVPYETVDCHEHRALAREGTVESVVLLKNDGILPLGSDLESIAVIGPNANNIEVLLGNYNGLPSLSVTGLQGIKNALTEETKIYYSKGCEWTGEDRSLFSEAVACASSAEITVLMMGLSPTFEGEEGDAYNSDAGGDRVTIDYPKVQQDLIEAVAQVSKKVILVNMSGGAINLSYAHDHLNAIIQAWYPGEEGGNGIADVVYGKVSPSARLPVTFMASTDDLPAFEDYAMMGRTYRFFERKPLYPFGYGLSYTTFNYKGLRLSSERIATGQGLQVDVAVTNVGDVAGMEAVQLYVKHMTDEFPVPLCQLAGIKKVMLMPGETCDVTFEISPRQLAIVDDEGRFLSMTSEVEIHVGGSQPDSRSFELTGRKPLMEKVKISGEIIELTY